MWRDKDNKFVPSSIASLLPSSRSEPLSFSRALSVPKDISVDADVGLNNKRENQPGLSMSDRYFDKSSAHGELVARFLSFAMFPSPLIGSAK